jgi:hypothetical protein
VIEGKIIFLLLDAEGFNGTNFYRHAVSGQALLFCCTFSKTESIEAIGVVKGIRYVVSFTYQLKVVAS